MVIVAARKPKEREFTREGRKVPFLLLFVVRET
jgi:hypothetical protein